MAGFLAPLLIGLAGAGVSAYANNQAAKRQQRAIEDQYQNKMSAKREQNAVLAEALDQYKPVERLANYEQAQSDVTDRLVARLNETPEELQGVSSATAGNVGSDYELAQGRATADSKKRAYKLASLLGRAGAHGDLFSQEGLNMAGAEQQQMLIGNHAMGQNMVDQQRIQEAGQVNPWLSLAGGAMQGYGTNSMKW